MSVTFVVVVTLLYVWAAGLEAINGRWHTATLLGGYAVANLGLVWGMLRG